MIDDKTAQMAINTISKYCQQFCGCSKCAIKAACRDMHRYDGEGTIFGIKTCYGDEVFKRCMTRPPKFDLRQKYSAYFQEYINKIFLEEAEKFELPMSMNNSIKWYESGEIKVTFVDDDATYVGVAKCHPDDAFNPEIGIKLAVERAAQAMHAPFIPGYNEHYYCVGNKDTIYSTVNRNEAADALCIALGNSFRTYNQAKANAGVIIKRIERATELLKKLQDEGEE